MTTWLGRVGLCACLVLLLLAHERALAQAPAGAAPASPSGSGLRVAVLRATQGDAGALAESVDGALLRDLAAIAGIENPSVSPIDYAEIQLTVGCSDEGRQCLSSIAKTVQVDAIVVRKLAVEADRATLTLVYLDATASDEPAHAEHVAEGEAGKSALASAVPVLVRRLFGIPEPVVAAAAEAQPTDGTPASEMSSPRAPPEPAPERGATVSPLTWVALGVGAAALGAGIVFGLQAQSTFDDFKNTQIDDEDDASTAEHRFDSAQSKGALATVLIPAGAAVLALGVTLLVVDLGDDGDDGPGETEVGLSPLPGGAMLSLRATAEGP